MRHVSEILLQWIAARFSVIFFFISVGIFLSWGGTASAAFEEDKFESFSQIDYQNAVFRLRTEGIITEDYYQRILACPPQYVLQLLPNRVTTAGVNSRLAMSVLVPTYTNEQIGEGCSFFELHDPARNSPIFTSEPGGVRTEMYLGFQYYIFYKEDGSWDAMTGVQVGTANLRLNPAICIQDQVQASRDLYQENVTGSQGVSYIFEGRWCLDDVYIPPETEHTWVLMFGNSSFAPREPSLGSERRLEYHWLFGTRVRQFRLDSSDPCVLGEEVVIIGSQEFRALLCPNSTLYERQFNSWVLSSEPTYLQWDVEEGSVCGYITYMNYNLRWVDGEFVCRATANPLVDDLLPPLEKPFLEAPFFDLEEVELGIFEPLRPVIQFGVDVVNTIAVFMTDVVNFVYEFLYNFARLLLNVLLPNPNSINFFFVRLRQMYSQKYNIDFSALNAISVYEANIPNWNISFGEYGNIVVDIQGALNDLGVATYVRPILSTFFVITSSIWVVGAFSNLFGRRELK